jgi:hypothetical protein
VAPDVFGIKGEGRTSLRGASRADAPVLATDRRESVSVTRFDSLHGAGGWGGLLLVRIAPLSGTPRPYFTWRPGVPRRTGVRRF